MLHNIHPGPFDPYATALQPLGTRMIVLLLLYFIKAVGPFVVEAIII